MKGGSGVAIEFQEAHSAKTLGPVRLDVIRRHELYDPDWCLVKISEGRMAFSLEKIVREEFARTGLVNTLFDWTVIAKCDAPLLVDRVGDRWSDRLVFRLLPPWPQWLCDEIVAVPLEGPWRPPAVLPAAWWATDGTE
ncbi:hypothetical protein C5L38_09270 [Streptomyces sp. WAC00288]|nr:hypothetical protein C5L38_09270 [Streptomyces sp. WAC00288]KYG53934.1 hypothetical protein AWI43_05155 [Streptomyces sp. WAC04657]